MKKILTIILVMITMCVISSSCEQGMGGWKDTERDMEGKVTPKDTTKHDSIPTPKDTTTNTDDGTWTRVSSALQVKATKEAISTILFQKKEQTMERILNYIFDWTYTVPSRVYVTTQATPTKGSVSKINEETTSLSDTTKSVQRTFKCETNIPGYTGKVVSRRVEGWTLVNGHREVFDNANESCEIVSIEKTGTPTEKVSHDSIYEVTPCRMSIRMFLKGQSWTDSKSTELWRFIKMKDNTTPTTNNMPTPNAWVDAIVAVTGSMSPEYTKTGADASIGAWHRAVLVEGKDYVYKFADGVYRGKEVNPGKGKLNSVIYIEGEWRAAFVKSEPDNRGQYWFTYAYRVGNETKNVSVAEAAALMSDLKNFDREHSASQTWKLKVYSETKEYSDGTQMKIWVKKNNVVKDEFTIGLHK